MRRLFFVMFLICLGLATVPTMAQDRNNLGGELKSLLGELLRGGEDNAPAADQAPGKADATEPTRRIPLGRAEMQLSFAPLVREVAPAVVNVYASQKMRPEASPFFSDPFFQQFFGGGPQGQPRVQSSLGSGVIVDGSGFIVTNYHVIRDADEVKVALSDGQEFECKIVLKDETVDLAVLKIKADKPLPSLKFGDSDALEVGDLVLAIGNPFGVGQTTTNGIVSALARTHIGVSDFGFFIQTDAAINPGNSGGALVDMQGHLVGINSAIFTRSGGSNGIGFAIPSNLVKAVVEAAKRGGEFFERPWLGAQFDIVDAQVAEALGMRRPSGALVANVTRDSPADKSGLKPGDVILAMNGREIENPDALGYRLATQSIGSSAEFSVLRKGKTTKLTAVLERAPEGASGTELEIEGRGPFAGTKVAQLSPRLAQRLRLPSEITGVVITDVARGSPAARFGLQPRDIVRELNGAVIRDPGQLKNAAEEQTRWWRFAIERDGQILRQVLRY